MSTSNYTVNSFVTLTSTFSGVPDLSPVPPRDITRPVPVEVEQSTVNKPKPPSASPQVYDILDAWAELMDFPRKANEGLGVALCASYGSCGISILSGINKTLPPEIVHKVLVERAASDKKTIREAFVMFSDTDHGGSKGGNALAEYIRENNLGSIVEAGPRMNPNSGNMIKMWIWSPPHESLHPEDKFMPVHGKILVRKYGSVYYEDDPRFKSNLSGQ